MFKGTKELIWLWSGPRILGDEDATRRYPLRRELAPFAEKFAFTKTHSVVISKVSDWPRDLQREENMLELVIKGLPL